MLTELVKALNDKKAILERELAAIQEKQALAGAGQEQLAQDAEEVKRRIALINEQSIKEYMALWQSFTPAKPLLCPYCFVFHKKQSTLKPFSRVDEVEHIKCTVCQETFEIPIELLYA